MDNRIICGGIEMLAPAYSPDPSELQPYKVDELPYKSGATDYGAAHGKYAAAYRIDEATSTYEEIIWDLATKTKQTIDLGPNLVVRSHYGLTKHHAWIGVSPPNSAVDKWVMRLKVE